MNTIGNASKCRSTRLIPYKRSYDGRKDGMQTRGNRVSSSSPKRLGRRTNPRHLQAFDLYVRQGLPVLRVARELGINPASVYVIGHRLTKQLKEEVSRLQAKLG